MSGKEEARIFVGGLSWETSERQLEAAFGRFGKVLDAQDDRWVWYTAMHHNSQIVSTTEPYGH